MAQGRRRAAMTASVLDALLRAPSVAIRLPPKVVGGLFALRHYGCGLRRKVVRVGRFELPYLEGGQGETLVLLHGFADSKESFVEVARKLTGQFRVILPDLPGFGEASAPTDFDYTLPHLAELVGKMLDNLGVESCHLGGNSLGGAVAVQLTLMRPSLANSLVLLNAAGLKMPTPSPLQKMLQDGENPFVMQNYADFKAHLRFVFEVQPPIPGPVRRHMADEYIARGPMYKKIMDDLLEADADLTPRLGEIEVPTFLLWGDKDRLIDLSVGQLYRERIEGAQLVILQDIGHAPQYEAPKQTIELIEQFLASATAQQSVVA